MSCGQAEQPGSAVSPNFRLSVTPGRRTARNLPLPAILAATPDAYPHGSGDASSVSHGEADRSTNPSPA